MPIGHGFSFFGHEKLVENQCWKRGLLTFVSDLLERPLNQEREHSTVLTVFIEYNSVQCNTQLIITRKLHRTSEWHPWENIHCHIHMLHLVTLVANNSSTSYFLLLLWFLFYWKRRALWRYLNPNRNPNPFVKKNSWLVLHNSAKTNKQTNSDKTTLAEVMFIFYYLYYKIMHLHCVFKHFYC